MSIFGKKSGSKSSGELQQTQTLDPLARQALTDVQQQARNLFQSNAPIYAPPDAATLAGLQNLQDRPQSEFIGQAGESLGGLLSSDYLQGGDLGAVEDRILSLASRAVGDQFTAAGRTGSPAEAISLGKTVTQELAPFIFSDLQSRRGAQLQALGLAPTVENLQNAYANRLLSVGDIVQGFNQQTLDEPYARFERYANPLISVAGGFPVDLTQRTKSKGSGYSFGGEAKIF